MMKRLLLGGMLALAGMALAQNTSTFGNISAGGPTCGAANCVYYQLPLSKDAVPQGTPWVQVTLSGTWAGTVEFATVSAPNATYSNLNSVTWTNLATVTANGTWSVATSGATYLLVVATSWSSGTAQVLMGASQDGAPRASPVLPGTVRANGIQAPTGGSSSNCWFTDGTSGSCGSAVATPNPPAYSLQFANSGATGMDSDPAIVGNPVTHALTAPIVNNTNEASTYASLALAVAGTPAGQRLHVAAGTYPVTAAGLTIANSIYIQCEKGATIQASGSRTVAAITVTGAGVIFDGCALDGGNASANALGVIELSGAANFTFKNGSITNFNDSSIRADGFSKVSIDHSAIATNITSNESIAIYSTSTYTAPGQPSGTSEGFSFTNSSITGTMFVGVGHENGNVQDVNVQGDTFYVGPGAFATTIGDYSIPFTSFVNNVNVSNNICNVVGTSSGDPAAGCFSDAIHVYGMTHNSNTINAQGQYVSIALMELAGRGCVASNNTFNAGQDPIGTQIYADIATYLGCSLAGNEFKGWGGQGSAIYIYPQGSADQVSVSGGSMVSDATASTAGNGAEAIKAPCNQAQGQRYLITSLSGSTVTGVAPYMDSAGSGGYTAQTGAATVLVTGSGSGLTLTTTVDANGHITSTTVQNGGTGYAIHSLIALAGTTSNYYGASIHDLEIGGGLSIQGPMWRAIDVQDAAGTGHCPVSAHVAGVTVDGATNFFYGAGAAANSTASIGNIVIKNVTNPSPVTSGGMVQQPSLFPFGTSSPGNITPAPQNMLPDSNFKLGPAYWTLGCNMSFVSSAGQFQEGAVKVTVPASPSGCLTSTVIPVLPSTTYSYSAYIDATAVSSGTNPYIWICTNSGGSCGSILSTQYQADGQKGTVFNTFTTGSGVTSIYFGINPGGMSGSGNIAYYSEPQFNIGSQVNAYTSTDFGSLNAANQAAPWPVPIPNVSVAIPSLTIPANTCYGAAGNSTPTTFTQTGVSSASTPPTSIAARQQGNASALVGYGTTGGLNIQSWASAANTGSYLVCNSTASSITSSAITVTMAAQ